MPRARNIKYETFTNDKLAELPFEARLLFIGLWTLADKAGRLEDRPRKIGAQLFPYDNLDISRLLQKLHESSFITRYKVGENDFIQINTFAKHQNPHKNEKDSEIPPLQESYISDCKIDTPEISRHLPSAPDNIGNAPADSLIPDSLIPDSLIPDSLREDPPPENLFKKFREAFPLQGRGFGSIKDAENKLKTALTKDSFENILNGVNSYAAYIYHTGQSNQDAFRWLEKERWRDDYIIRTTPNNERREYEEAAVRGMLRAENPDF